MVVVALPRLSCGRATLPTVPSARLATGFDGPEMDPALRARTLPWAAVAIVLVALRVWDRKPMVALCSIRSKAVTRPSGMVGGLPGQLTIR